MNEVRNIFIGFEFTKKRTQLCYYDRKTQEPVSIPTKLGTNLFTFPTVLCKIEGKDEWHFGVEAELFGARSGGIPIPNLYGLVFRQEHTIVEGKRYEPCELLAVFLEKTLAMTGVRNIKKALGGIMVTTDDLTQKVATCFRDAFTLLGFTEEQFAIQNFDESFYYYMIYQRQEFWNRSVALFDFHGTDVMFRSFRADHVTRPMKIYLSESITESLPALPEQRDSLFCDFAKRCFGEDTYSSVYITGDGFDEDWAVKSVPFLCAKQRHVFVGDNLYVKGACYAVKDKKETGLRRKYSFAGRDLINTGVGMQMLVNGTSSYVPLVIPGVNWYEVMSRHELLLEDTQELVFEILGPDEQSTEHVMHLPGLPKRPPKATRLAIHTECDSDKNCFITVTDLGLGDLYPATQATWKESLRLQ